MGDEVITVGLGATGWVVIVLYLAAVVILGSLFARGQDNVSEFFLAGRSMGWLAVGISIYATNLSAISYIGTPSWIYREDTRYMFISPSQAPFWALGAFIFLSLFYRLNLYTAYEFLERRFHVSIRTATSLLFVIVRGVWVATALFGASFALSVVLNIPFLYSVIAAGVLATLYTTLGGMKAVIWTDVLQFLVLVGGAVAVLVVAVRMFPGGMGEVWDIAMEHGKLRVPGFQLDPQEKVTWLTIVGGAIIGTVAYFTTDQVILQRALSTKSRRDAILSGVWTAVLSVPLDVLFVAVAIALYAVYATNPALNAALLALSAKGIPEPADALLPHFVATQLHPAGAGLIVAAIFAATMSSVDSGLNSLTTVCTMDYYRRFFHKPNKTEGHYLRVARWGTVAWGIVATAGAIGVAKLNLQTILQKLGEITGPFSGPMVGIFALGMLTRRANTVGCLSGGAIALVVGLALKPHMAFTWYSTVTVVLTMIMGYGISLLWSGTKNLRFVRRLFGGAIGAVVGLILSRATYIHTLPPAVSLPLTLLLVGAVAGGCAVLWTRFKHEIPMEQVNMLTVYRPADAEE